MGFAEDYFSKQVHFHPLIKDPPSERLHYVVVIPAFCEEELLHAIEALWNCTRPSKDVEVIVVVNSPENADTSVIQSNYQSIREIKNWMLSHNDPTFRVMPIEAFNLPVKHAGAGMARKIGMDEAAYRLNINDQPEGYIVSFDADCTCDTNYFLAIEEGIKKHPAADGFNIYFEHPVSGEKYPKKIYLGITQYELHLRYVNLFLRYVGFPHAFHTVGSAFAVKAATYARQGGMNKRKAGEDFYFLHKIIPLGNFYEINNTRIIPSPRPSDRVPFGTGPAIYKFISSPDHTVLTYHPDSFLILRNFLTSIHRFFKISQTDCNLNIENIPEPLKSFLQKNQATQAIDEINNNCNNIRSFTNKFLRWFDAFRIIKFLNETHRNHCYHYVSIREASLELLKHMGLPFHADDSEIELLTTFRELEKGNRIHIL